VRIQYQGTASAVPESIPKNIFFFDKDGANGLWLG
jgi:hypothetical protein